MGSKDALMLYLRKCGRAWFIAPVLKTDVPRERGREFESHRFRHQTVFINKLMKNQIPWNKGKKVGSFITPDGLTRISLSSKSRKHTEEIKKRISAKMKGNRNANHRGDRQSFYNNIRMDSRWEVGVARWLDKSEAKRS